jgi:glucokinase
MSAALAGDASALAAWNEVGAWLGRGVAQLAAFFDPEVVVVGGGPSAAGDLLLDPARSELNAVLHGRTARPAVPLVAARFRENGSVIGAGLMALEAVHD